MRRRKIKQIFVFYAASQLLFYLGLYHMGIAIPCTLQTLLFWIGGVMFGILLEVRDGA